MAENKKSFIAYTDWGDIFDELTDEEAGILVKHLFNYVRDKNPEPKDKLTKMMFIQIKASLKRDLNKYENKKKKHSDAGILGNLKRYHIDLYELIQSGEMQLDEAQQLAKGRKAIQGDSKLAVSDSDSDSDSDSVNVSDILLKKETKVFNFKKSLLDYGFKEQLISDWLKVRKKKRSANTETAFKSFIKQVELTGKDKNEIMTLVVGNSWQSFKADWIENKQQKQEKGKTASQAWMELVNKEIQ